MIAELFELLRLARELARCDHKRQGDGACPDCGATLERGSHGKPLWVRPRLLELLVHADQGAQAALQMGVAQATTKAGEVFRKATAKKPRI